MSEKFTVQNGGKGSSPRDVDKKKFDDNWDRIFKKNDKPQKDPRPRPS